MATVFERVRKSRVEQRGVGERGGGLERGDGIERREKCYCCRLYLGGLRI